MEEFLKFAYELRKQDHDDKYSEMLIRDHVTIPVLYELIMANSFKDVMEFDNKRLEVKISTQ